MHWRRIAILANRTYGISLLRWNNTRCRLSQWGPFSRCGEAVMNSGASRQDGGLRDFPRLDARSLEVTPAFEDPVEFAAVVAQAWSESDSQSYRLSEGQVTASEKPREFE